ncbi:MAG: hypothetical protein Q8880_06635 [Bacteroidota bacterium]|nr:hypothetical protein [Bacteroidota bacterium]
MKRIIKPLFAIALFMLSNTIFSQDIETGLKYLDLNLNHKAAYYFSDLASKNPTNGKAFYYAGQAYFILGKNDSANYFYTKGVEADKNLAYNYIGVGKMLLQKGNVGDAFTNFEQAMKISKKDPIVYTLIGEAYYLGKEKNYTKALEYLNKAKDLDYKNIDMLLTMGDMYMDQNNGGEALRYYGRATDFKNNCLKAWVKVGVVNTKANLYRDALAAFNNAKNIDSNYIPLYRELGELQYLAGKYDEACKAYAKYLAMGEYDVKDVTRYAYALYLNKDYKTALNYINKVLATQPDDPTMLRLSSYCMYETNDYKNGLVKIDKFFKIIDQTKIISSDYEYYAKLLNKDGQDSLAVINYLKAISMDNSKCELYETIAKIYDNKKRYIDAGDNYDKLVKCSKNPSAQDYYMVGKSYFFGAVKIDSTKRNMYYYKADSAFMKVAELSPTSHIGNIFRARVCSRIDPDSKLGLAKPHYEAVIKLLESNPDKYKKELIEAYTYLGIYYYLQDDKDKSKENMEKVKALDPNDPNANNILKLLSNPAQKKGVKKTK